MYAERNGRVFVNRRCSFFLQEHFKPFAFPPRTLPCPYIEFKYNVTYFYIAILHMICYTQNVQVTT